MLLRLLGCAHGQLSPVAVCSSSARAAAVPIQHVKMQQGLDAGQETRMKSVISVLVLQTGTHMQAPSKSESSLVGVL